MIANRAMEYLGGSGVAVGARAALVAANQCGTSMVRNLGELRDDPRRIRTIRPSDSWACGRRLVYNALGLETGGYGWRSRLTFTHGDMTEAMGILIFKQALLASGEEHLMLTPYEDGTQLELTALVDPSDWEIDGKPFQMTGHVDMTIVGHLGQEEPVDWKSINRYAFPKAQAAASDPKHEWWEKEDRGYVAQLRWYMLLLRLMGRSTPKHGYLVFVCKDTGHLTEVMVEHSRDEEVKLVKAAVYVNEQTELANARKATVFDEFYDHTDDCTAKKPDVCGDCDCGASERADVLYKANGNEATDILLEAHVSEHVPRPQWAESLVVERKGATMRPDGTKGTCLEIDAKRHPNGFRCNYCDHKARCWPDFGIVPLSSGPVMRTNG